MADVTLSYKGSDILELSNSGSATLKTGGKYCEDDIGVEYVKPSGGSDQYEMLLAVNNNTETSISNGDITTVRECMFYGDSELESVSLPNATSIGYRAFYNCTNLASLNLPKCATLNEESLGNCKALTKISDDNFPLLTDLRIRVFRSCTALTHFIKPKTRMGFGGVCFEYCSSLRVVDVDSWFYQYGNQSLLFQRCTNFDTFIIRNKDSISGLGALNYITQYTPWSSTGTGGTLYVPQALISSYENATNWSTILSYENNQILPIEGSYYETHYGDGTEITS